MKGMVQVYTGDGKGKTTAALGLALRASGAGLRVAIFQFVKGEIYSEIKAIREFLPAITVKQFGRKCFIRTKPEPEDIRLAQEGLKEVKHAITEGQYDLIILDEANIAVHFQLFTADNLLEIIQSKPEDVELVITGRNADLKILAAADLVTEMKEIKHYYHKGIPAREGIEY
ncbi:MAG: cob(I)yrinic acid a,c-diamide adenosyltransferase [Candidatus Marinimicrobia bacterium]|nr:cob(I)yrinic acid a,c-diamide adenosyltransferase [Candidatus Neomarinimicrobiota bacterium]